MAAKCSPALVDTVPTMVLEADRKVAQRTRGTGRVHKYKYRDKANTQRVEITNQFWRKPETKQRS